MGSYIASIHFYSLRHENTDCLNASAGGWIPLFRFIIAVAKSKRQTHSFQKPRKLGRCLGATVRGAVG